MKCNNCNSEIRGDEKFCGHCGNKIEQSEFEEKKYDQYSSDETDSTKRRIYKGKADLLEKALDIIKNILISEKLEYQIHKEINSIIIQGRKKTSFLKKALGLDMAATIKIEKYNQDLIINIGGGKWMDKLSGGAIAWFVFWPALLTTGWGIYLQQTLFKKIDNQLLTYLN